MRMNAVIRQYIVDKKLTFSSVAEKSNFDIKKFSRWMTNRQAMSTDEYERICINGLGVNPGYFYSKNFLESKNESNSA